MIMLVEFLICSMLVIASYKMKMLIKETGIYKHRHLPLILLVAGILYIIHIYCYADWVDSIYNREQVVEMLMSTYGGIFILSLMNAIFRIRQLNLSQIYTMALDAQIVVFSLLSVMLLVLWFMRFHRVA